MNKVTLVRTLQLGGDSEDLGAGLLALRVLIQRLRPLHQVIVRVGTGPWPVRHYLIRSSSQGGGNGVTVFVLQGRIPWTLPIGI